MSLRPFPVELVSHDPSWVERARDESARLAGALGPLLIEVHHIGSTAIPGILAKPIVDLLPVVIDIEALEEFRPRLEALGYTWHGELGLPGRRYLKLDDPATGRRLVQLHCYQEGNASIERHVAFRNYLISRPGLAREYEAEKCRCRDLHPLDTHAYTDCKEAWIKRVEAAAIDFFRVKWPL